MRALTGVGTFDAPPPMSVPKPRVEGPFPLGVLAAVDDDFPAFVVVEQAEQFVGELCARSHRHPVTSVAVSRR